jgi:hypothetical protein
MASGLAGCKYTNTQIHMSKYANPYLVEREPGDGGALSILLNRQQLRSWVEQVQHRLVVDLAGGSEGRREGRETEGGEERARGGGKEGREGRREGGEEGQITLQSAHCSHCSAVHCHLVTAVQCTATWPGWRARHPAPPPGPTVISTGPPPTSSTILRLTVGSATALPLSSGGGRPAARYNENH